MLEIQDYGNADVRWECLFQVKEGIIEVRVHRVNFTKVHTELCALREWIQERDVIVAEMAAG